DAEDANTLNFAYPSAAPTRRGREGRSWAMLPYLRPGVKLEFGAGSDPYPVGRYPVTAYAAEVFPQVFTEPQFTVTVLEAERTFWEKATLAHAEYHRPAGSPTPSRISRHYYDLHQLAQSERGRRALADRNLLRRVVEHKQVYFASGWAHYETTTSGGLHLAPHEARRHEVAQDYERMRDMFFGPFPRLDEILAMLRSLEAEVNSQ
ncbi:MAG TPA: nucleotidyl transferase AbiEii/AbiGii toxin family protein, partial [Armatimonadota bacterium]|nr:nucleotidyl transferase AbiEii/AbiGii toxin family protein [Armatimonadota bacterium]